MVLALASDFVNYSEQFQRIKQKTEVIAASVFSSETLSYPPV